ncbi:dihydrofolate reductase [Actinomadura darangshiensis]|uniref:Dihydrofolate reductase n=1 Tax=Actinomadura darangshiensis TaxID=705336 RepID=A0A4R5A1B4_9ACTN|nr:dihydrofolate reductase family protein [Actinomadura darangshiensis]TDD64536.1 dihydrofolate reductase [Actinomadura darangshiensis]
MGKLVLVEHLSLDGVMQGPAAADEDTRGGFGRGGWAVAGNDQVMGAEMGKRMGGDGAVLLGRRTYEDLYGFWPGQTDGNPFTDVLNRVTKYVVSRTLGEPLPWENSVLVRDVAGVGEIKRRTGLTVIGSGELSRELMRQGLVDEWLLMVHPLVLGSGLRLFERVEQGLRLVDSVTTSTGVVIATYEKEEA